MTNTDEFKLISQDIENQNLEPIEIKCCRISFFLFVIIYIINNLLLLYFCFYSNEYKKVQDFDIKIWIIIIIEIIGCCFIQWLKN